MCGSLCLPSVSLCLPEQFTAVGVILVIDCFLQNAAEMKRQPAQSKNQHQAEHRLGHFPPLHRQRQILMLPKACDSSKSFEKVSDALMQSFACVPVSCGR